MTSAALVMVGVFAIFGTLSWMMFKQMGVGLAFAVLLDATLIRGVLLPATMKLLGDWNWWLPKRARLAAPGRARGGGGAREGVARRTHISQSTRRPPSRRAPVVAGRFRERP